MSTKEITPLYTLKKLESSFPKKRITKSEDAVEFVRQLYDDDIEVFESFFIVLMDRRNFTIGCAKISQGGVAATVVDAKLICKYICDTLACSIILTHNHPSGNLLPSQSDKDLTNQLKEVTRYLECPIFDHILLTKDAHYSFADNGDM